MDLLFTFSFSDIFSGHVINYTEIKCMQNEDIIHADISVEMLPYIYKILFCVYK